VAGAKADAVKIPLSPASGNLALAHLDLGMRLAGTAAIRQTGRDGAQRVFLPDPDCRVIVKTSGSIAGEAATRLRLWDNLSIMRRAIW
jgi:hypothetical protein